MYVSRVVSSRHLFISARDVSNRYLVVSNPLEKLAGLRQAVCGNNLGHKREPPPGIRTRRKFIRFAIGTASRRRIKSISARPLSLRKASNTAWRFL